MIKVDLSPETMTYSGDRFMSSAKEADVSKLDNPAWPKANHQARTELCV
jgi:hypothetical protein